MTIVVDLLIGSKAQTIHVPEGKNPFDVLARAQDAVDVAARSAKPGLDKGKATGDNSSSSSSSQHRNAQGTRQAAFPPSSPPAPGAVPSSSPTGAPAVPAADLFAKPDRVDGDRPDAPPVNPRPAPARADSGSAPSGAGPVGPRGGVRDTSMAAYRALQWSGRLGEQEQTVVDHFMKSANPAGWTRQELARDVVWKGKPMSINAVCGRVNALLADPFNVLVELDEKKTCTVTGNRVNALALAVDKPKGEEG